MMTSLLIDGYATDEKGNKWRDIPGYEGTYQASEDGHVRTAPGKVTRCGGHHNAPRVWKVRVLKEKREPRSGSDSSKADARVTLYKDGKPITELVSRLVARAWCSGYDDGLTVNHINGDPTDNRALNLEWVTHAENIRKGFDSGLYANNMRKVSLSFGGKRVVFQSMASADRFVGRYSGYVSACVKRGSAFGYSARNERFDIEIVDEKGERNESRAIHVFRQILPTSEEDAG